MDSSLRENIINYKYRPTCQRFHPVPRLRTDTGRSLPTVTHLIINKAGKILTPPLPEGHVHTGRTHFDTRPSPCGNIFFLIKIPTLTVLRSCLLHSARPRIPFRTRAERYPWSDGKEGVVGRSRGYPNPLVFQHLRQGFGREASRGVISNKNTNGRPVPQTSPLVCPLLRRATGSQVLAFSIFIPNFADKLSSSLNNEQSRCSYGQREK